MTILVAGTFSRIHRGHALLILAAYTICNDGEMVEISLTSDNYAHKYKKHYIPLYDRMQIMKTFLENMYGCSWIHTFKLTAFDSPFDGVEDINVNYHSAKDSANIQIEILGTPE